VLACRFLQAPLDDQALASRFLTNLIVGDTIALANDLDSTLTVPAAWSQVLAVRDSFLVWDPDSLRLIGWNVANFPAEHTANLTYQLHGTRGWFLASVNLRGTPDHARIRGFHWQFVPDRLDQVHRFTLAGKPVGAYLVLALTILMAGISVGTAAILAFSKLPRRWAWAPLALVGCTRLDLNWTTGATAFQPFMLQLFSAGFQRASSYALWIISVSFPLGAMLAWRRLMTWRKEAGSDRDAAA
jgi:hypothetical protein